MTRIVLWSYLPTAGAGAFTRDPLTTPGDVPALAAWPRGGCTILGVMMNQACTDIQLRPEGQNGPSVTSGGAAIPSIGGTLPLRVRGGESPPFLSGTAAAALTPTLILEI